MQKDKIVRLYVYEMFKKANSQRQKVEWQLPEAGRNRKLLPIDYRGENRKLLPNDYGVLP